MISGGTAKPHSWRAFLSSSSYQRAGKIFVLSAVGAVVLAVAAVIVFKPALPENAEDYEPVRPSKIELMSVYSKGVYQKTGHVPIVTDGASKSDFKQATDGFYNKLNMRCRVRIVAGLPAGTRLDECRIRVTTSRAACLLRVHAAGSSILSDEFVCIRNSRAPMIPGVQEIEAGEDDQVKAVLVVPKAVVK